MAGLTLALPSGRFDRRGVPAMGRLLAQVAAETAERLYGGGGAVAPVSQPPVSQPALGAVTLAVA